MILVNLMDDRYPVMVDERSAQLGGSFYLNPDLQPYSPLPLKWAYQQLMHYEKATLFDIGASTGSFTLLSKHHPYLEVHAFEPVQLTSIVLRENVYLNQLSDRVIVNEVGISNYNGAGTMHVIKDIGGLGVSILDGQPAGHKDTEPFQVEVMTVDKYCKMFHATPTMLKIDTEGAEKLVLEGAQETIEKHHPFLLFEYQQVNCDQYGYRARDMIKMVEDWGYTWTCPEGLDIMAVPIGWETLIQGG